MPKSDVIIQLITEFDQVLYDESVSESESIEDSISESESIRESEEKEKLNLDLHGYVIQYDISEVEAPYSGFIVANDNSTFQ